jgi:hypothetical protein
MPTGGVHRLVGEKKIKGTSSGRISWAGLVGPNLGRSVRFFFLLFFLISFLFFSVFIFLLYLLHK